MKKRQQSMSTRAIFSAVHDILESERKPVPLRVLYSRLVELGVPIGGQNPRHNLAQKLHAEEEFKAYGRRGWHFANLPPWRLNNSAPMRESGPNEKDPDDGVAGPSLSDGSEGLVSRPTSVPSGRDQSCVAMIPSAPQPQDKERGNEWLG
jgi:hypothetical protein